MSYLFPSLILSKMAADRPMYIMYLMAPFKGKKKDEELEQSFFFWGGGECLTISEYILYNVCLFL